MNLKKKKILAAKVLNVGANRIMISKGREKEIKEAITRQDIRDLVKEGLIKIKEIGGRKKKKKRKTRRREGKRKKRMKKRKQEYVKITRKLRKYIKELKKQGKIGNEEYREIRKKIKSRNFDNKSQLKEFIKGLK